MHQEVLTKEGAALLPTLSRFSGFYLAGGTALALQIGHRLSVDFDLFRNEPITRSLLPRVERTFPFPATPLVNNSDELTVAIHGVKITFLNYPFPVLDPFEIYDGLPLLSVREIAATKAYTIGRRGSYKDYVDLYFVLAEGHTTLPEIITNAEKKFGDQFNARLFLEQLVYLGDVQDTEIQFLKEVITPKRLLAFFEDRIRAAAEDLV
ncbi:nucleotidyl transferase AbiEii/AbiGii toxin family protein [Bradyrhizobium sp. LTSPM299]|uniref:nucleotidyl transferase AbiEii/AbiGii toxin family protein n=1 Tax=Bradyrhizobium sp. LTSPM299 TaxID=1619233 RepID=UPI00067963B2|nr:nucleotidyl transferase AbiEii/AbiGii toxin family protein [Bradyrhizobium sp. LTSPM299]